jgi:L-ascorbate metabolism protein UlaG (beta-lactamase superfamily)
MPIKSFCSPFALILSLGLLLPPAVTAQDKAPVSDTIFSQSGEIKIYPINHATLALQWHGRTVYIDPVGGAQAFHGLPRPDLILITHFHGDHFSQPTLSAVVGGGLTDLVGPPSVVAQLPPELSGHGTTLTNGQIKDFQGIRVEAVPAYNLTPARLNNHPKGRDNGYVLTLGEKRIYVSGDTEDIPEMLALKDIDVACVCMNGPTMNVDQAARAVKAFKPKIVYPYHYRGSDLEKFKSLVGTDQGVEVRIRDWYPAR